MSTQLETSREDVKKQERQGLATMSSSETDEPIEIVFLRASEIRRESRQTQRKRRLGPTARFKSLIHR